MTQRILLVSLMALPLHRHEEYALPGGGEVPGEEAVVQ